MKTTKKPKETIYKNRIKEVLVKRNMCIAELSDLTNLNSSHLSRIVSGQRKCISLPIAFKISNALNLTIEDLFVYQNTKQQEPQTEE